MRRTWRVDRRSARAFVPWCGGTAVALLAAGGARAQFSGLNFGPAVAVGSVVYPQAVALGDVDGDRALDAVVGADSGVWLFRGVGRGAFAPPVLIAPPAACGKTKSIVLCDLDQGGSLDLVSATCRGVMIARGRGDGSFDEGTYIRTGDPMSAPYTEETVTDIVATDLNGDGHMDIVVTQSVGGTIAPGWATLLVGDGALGLEVAAVLRTPGYALHAACADVDGDGDVDIVFAGSSDNTRRRVVYAQVFTNDGAAGFAPGGPQPLANFNVGGVDPGAPTDLATADLDGDGDQDLLVAMIESSPTGIAPSSVRIMRNDGGGVFVETGALRSERSAWRVAAAELNGDGIPDIVLSSAVGRAAGGGVEVFRNLGDGPRFAGPSAVLETGFARHTAWADIDGHGGADLLTADIVSGPVFVILNFTPQDGAMVPDLDGDMSVNARDVGIELACWTAQYPLGDINTDGGVDARDLALVLGSYGMSVDAPAWWDTATQRAASAAAPSADETRAMAAQLMLAADADHDGRVTSIEFVRALAGTGSHDR